MAIAMFQLFLRASAAAATAAFLALSRLIGAPYGLGICANALDAHSASRVDNRAFTRGCSMRFLLGWVCNNGSAL